MKCRSTASRIIDNLITTTPVQPMIEAVQEVEIQTGTYSAQYGSYLGVHINMIPKSGTNQLHGSLFPSFVTNQVFDARTFFTLPTRPPIRPPPSLLCGKNRFSVEVDGPVADPAPL